MDFIKCPFVLRVSSKYKKAKVKGMELMVPPQLEAIEKYLINILILNNEVGSLRGIDKIINNRDSFDKKLIKKGRLKRGG